MRLRSEADVQEFLDAVSQCGGDVYLKSPEGDIFNLKSSMSRYIAIGRLSEEQIRTAGFDTYFVDRTAGVYPTAASGFPYSAASMAVKGDLIADLTEDLAAEQKARVTYDNILRLSDDPDVNDVIKFLRAREIVHFQRFGEGLRLAKDKMNEKNLYFVNPSFDK